MFRRRLLVAVAFFALVAPAWAEERILRVVSPYIAARMEIAETLTQVEPDRRITGGIADSWAVSGGKLTWRFHLALGLNFHDGTPVTAAAVKASFDRCLAGAESLRTVPIASVAADGDSLAVATKTPSRPCRRS
jgi:peptide/nickel transport system substrate-binding protein